MTRAVLFDKDGTLVENVPMNADPNRLRLVAGVEETLSLLCAAGFRIAVVSNQPGVALGMFTEGELAAVEARLRGLLAPVGVRLDGFFYCPHHPNAVIERYRGPCGCRKPEPGLVSYAARSLNVEPQHCWVVGDILDDVEAAHRAGCRAILFDSGGETEWADSPLRRPEFTTSSMSDVASHILADPSRRA